MALAAELRSAVGALDVDVALEARPGGCLALAGPSGAGKSTVLRMVAGLLRPAAGVVRCGDETWLDTGRGTDLAPERRRCGYVFQDYALFGHLSAWRNVAYPLRHLGRRARRAEALALLERFSLRDRADARPAELSGGERQRVALARALARRPRALLLDEPLAALDVRTRAQATRTLAALLRQTDIPALLVTHDFAEAATLADRVGILDGGRIVQWGTPSELAARPRSAFVADFTGAVVLHGTASAGPAGLTRVALDGGGEVFSTDAARGPVAVSVFPWEVGVEPLDGQSEGSARNRLVVRIASVTVIGNRVRLGLDAAQPLAAEVTRRAVERIGLEPGGRVAAVWKATATRLVAR